MFAIVFLFLAAILLLGFVVGVLMFVDVAFRAGQAKSRTGKENVQPILSSPAVIRRICSAQIE